MLVTELYKGQGLGNQLACYIATRVIAADKNYDFGIMHPENFKGAHFFDLDFGKTVAGGSGPEGGPPSTLPDGIIHYYREKILINPANGSDIRSYDKDLTEVADNTKIDGTMQGEGYIAHRKNEIRKWLAIKPEHECYDYADENTCVINFRGGEYARHSELFLRKEYWMRAIAHMRDINKNFRFVVITDDEFLAKKFFPDFDVFHFDIAKDYVVLKNAKYLILSNSSFAWFPAWLNEDLRLCIAPKYWARHNISDGYWSCSYNLTQGWMYQDREGILSDYDTCKKELDTYMESHSYLFKEELEFVSPKDTSITGILKRHLPRKVKHFIKFLIGTGQRIVLLVRSPFDRAREKKRRAMWLSNVQIAEYRKNIKVYDVFNFFNELETLDIRLNILNEYVDYFVIVESTLTHSGKPKELFYEKNKHLFKEFEHKIIHYVITTPIKNRAEAEMRLNNSETLAQDREILSLALNSENTKNADDSFLRDFYEKESVKIPLEGLADNDFCFISDLDEIWNPETLVDFSKDDVYKFKQIAYVYYLNNRSNEDWRGWTGTIGTKYKNIRGACVNHLRKSKDQKYIVIENGGWHFTFQGGIDRIKTKIESYSHQELNTNETKSEINQRLTQNKDFAGRYFKFKIDETDLPPYLLKNKEKYKKFFK